MKIIRKIKKKKALSIPLSFLPQKTDWEFVSRKLLAMNR